MKTKIISLVLILSILLSMFTVFSFAADTKKETAENLVTPYLHYKNSFGDDLDDVGASPSLINATNSYIELKEDTAGNGYGQFNYRDNANVYTQLNPTKSFSISDQSLGYLFFEFDFNDLGNLLSTSKFLEIHSGEGTLGVDRFAETNILNVGNDGSSNFFYFKNSKSNKVYINKNEWTKVRVEFSISSETQTTYDIKCIINGKTFATSYKLGSPKIITHIRYGNTNNNNPTFGLDDIILYSSPKYIDSYEELSSIKNALLMKVGAENAKMNNTQIELVNTPILVNNVVYCPVDILEEYTAIECTDEYIVVFDGVEYIRLDDVSTAFGKSVRRHDMGLILIGEEDDLELYDDSEYDVLTDLMKTFVFNIPTADDFKQDVKEYTNNFTHPYIMADADKFAELRSIYNAGQNGRLTSQEDLQLYDYIKRYVNSAVTQLKNYCNISPTETYKGLVSSKIPTNPNYSKYNNNGYDNGGRASIPTGPLYPFAFAYQITGNLNYARAAYDYSLALGEWNHWGPAHFLNCADTAAPFSISYDWLYNAYKELGAKGEISKFDGEVYDTTKLAKIILTHAIVPGYVQSNAINSPWPGSVESRYHDDTNNWNAVCTSGMVASALAILGEEISTEGITFDIQTKSTSGGTVTFTTKTVSINEIGNTIIHKDLSTYADYAAKLASMNMNSLVRYGLIEYAPDGSYVESPGYWSYGTNSFFRMVACLMTATGDDYGFMDSWGMDTTCYFAIHSESSDYKTWNFNDGSVGAQDSSYFFFVGGFYGDENLIRVRKKHLSSGKSYSLFDILFYDTTVTGEPELATEYYMQGIDGFAVRSSWDKGSIYAGIIGGPNTVSHGHMDAGSFVYHNNGKIWFTDLGADNYNIVYYNKEGKKKGYFSNYELYRIGAEGHNIIAITSEQDTLPYGQLPSADPHIVRHYADGDNGGYAILDLSNSYGSHVSSAKRGMLFTDSRSTVIIQDEIVFNGEKTAYWFGHYNLASGYVDDVIVASDGRTAFMKSGDDMIRVSIVSENTDLKFEIMDAYTYLLDITHRTDKATMQQPETESNRDTVRKLAIKCENVTELNLAVVIEDVSNYNTGTSYKWTNMDSWTVKSEETPKIEYNFKADYEDYGFHIGSNTFECADGLFEIDELNSEINSYLALHSTKAGALNTDAKLEFVFNNNSSGRLSKSRYFVAEMDLLTDSRFPAGAKLALYTKDLSDNTSYVTLAEFSNNGITVNGEKAPLTEDWSKISVVYDKKERNVYFYVNDCLLTKTKNESLNSAASASAIAIIIPSGCESDGYSSVLVDNVTARTLGTLYDGNLAQVLLSGNSLSTWEDNISVAIDKIPLATLNDVILYSAAEIESALQNGHTINLLRDCNSRINVSGAGTVNTNGYKFNFVSDTHIAEINEDSVTFKTGSIRVIWHIGNGTISETYQSSTVATFKKSMSEIGQITEKRIEYANGYIGFQYYTTGWSAIKGGQYLDDDKMVVTNQNCEFWLVNNKPLECLYVIETTSGQLLPYYSESELRGELSKNTSAKKIVLCSDVELKNNQNSTISLATYGKNFYLNGHTIYNSTYDTHLFTFSASAYADFNFYGPGIIDVTDPRTIFNSGAATNKNKYGIVVKGVDIYTNTQLSDLRIGQHRFIDCYIYQNTTLGKSFIDIWDRNGVITNGVSSNLVTMTFENCEIYRENGASRSMFSYTGATYSEIYLIDTKVTSDGYLMSSDNPDVLLNISGRSVINVNGISAKAETLFNALTFEDGVITNLSLDKAYIPAGAALAVNYSTVLPYKVSTSYATVKWFNLLGEVILEEYVTIGEEAKPYNTTLLKYLKSVNVGSTEYVYNSFVVNRGGIYNIDPQLSNPGIVQTMTVERDFALEILIPKSMYESQVRSLRVNDILITDYNMKLIERDGVEYYCYRMTQVSPLGIFDMQNVVLTLNDSTVKRASLSVFEYLRKLLYTSRVDSEKILAIKILKYAKSVYDYNNLTGGVDYNNLQSLIDENKQWDILYNTTEDEYTSTKDIKFAVKSVALKLSASLRMRFYINPEYTGTITTEYLGNSKEIVVKDGKYNGSDYFDVELTACNMQDDIVISASGYSIVYNIENYKTMLNTRDSKLEGVLHSLGEYAAAAKEYQNA